MTVIQINLIAKKYQILQLHTIQSYFLIYKSLALFHEDKMTSLIYKIFKLLVLLERLEIENLLQM